MEVELDAREARLLEELKGDPDFFDFSDEEIVRFCFYRWWAERYMRGPKQLKTLG